jgi:hypothetical protein
LHTFAQNFSKVHTKNNNSFTASNAPSRGDLGRPGLIWTQQRIGTNMHAASSASEQMELSGVYPVVNSAAPASDHPAGFVDGQQLRVSAAQRAIDY